MLGLLGESVFGRLEFHLGWNFRTSDDNYIIVNHYLLIDRHCPSRTK